VDSGPCPYTIKTSVNVSFGKITIMSVIIIEIVKE
jgi:hypothetical protein